MEKELTQVQKNLLVLELVKACMEYGKDVRKSFEDVLNEDVFPEKPYEAYVKMVCRTLETLNRQSHVSGVVELEFETEIDPDTFEKTATDVIDTTECTFEDIEITAKGNSYMSSDSFKEAGKISLKRQSPL